MIMSDFITFEIETSYPQSVDMQQGSSVWSQSANCLYWWQEKGLKEKSFSYNQKVTDNI